MNEPTYKSDCSVQGCTEIVKEEMSGTGNANERYENEINTITDRDKEGV